MAGFFEHQFPGSDTTDTSEHFARGDVQGFSGTNTLTYICDRMVSTGNYTVLLEARLKQQDGTFTHWFTAQTTTQAEDSQIRAETLYSGMEYRFRNSIGSVVVDVFVAGDLL